MDELQKIAHGHEGMADIATEAFGIPGATLTGGWKAGVGALGGFGLGLGVRHAFNKATEGTNFAKNHPILRAGLAAASLATPSAMGAVAIPHFLKKAGKLKTAGIIDAFLANASRPYLTLNAVNEVGKIPDRFRRYEAELAHDPYDQPGDPPHVG